MIPTCHRCGAPRRPFRFCRKCWLADRKQRGLDDPRERVEPPIPQATVTHGPGNFYVNGQFIGTGTFSFNNDGGNA